MMFTYNLTKYYQATNEGTKTTVSQLVQGWLYCHGPCVSMANNLQTNYT